MTQVDTHSNLTFCKIHFKGRLHQYTHVFMNALTWAHIVKCPEHNENQQIFNVAQTITIYERKQSVERNPKIRDGRIMLNT